MVQMKPDSLASYPETHRAIIEGRPAWATAGFAIAVFGGALACLLLLLRKAFSVYVFIASLPGVIVTMVHTLGIINSTNGFGLFEITMTFLLPLLVAALLIWYASYTVRKGWIN